jgi:hypothetical protein
MNWNKYSLFKLPNRHRRFEYVPRYYDKRKEELNKKIRAAKRAAAREQGVKTEGIDKRREISFREEVSDKWGNTQYKSAHMAANIRLVVIFGIAIIAFFFLFDALDDVGPWLDDQTGK